MEKTRSFSRFASGVLRPASGQAIVEALVAMGALTVGLVGVLALLNQSLGLNRVVADSYKATYLASEGIEVVKNILDRNVILNAQGTPTSWTQGVCTFPGGGGSFEVQYDTTDLTTSPPYLGNSSAASSRPLLFDPALHYQYGTGSATSFIRTVRINCPSAFEVVVTSEVDWTTRGKGTFQTIVEDHFFNWH